MPMSLPPLLKSPVVLGPVLWMVGLAVFVPGEVVWYERLALVTAMSAGWIGNLWMRP